MTRADMDAVREAFVASAQMADRAGFDWLELHCAHGYLLSAFITPLTNRRTDEYGGTPREPAALSARSAARGAGGVAGGQADLGAHLGAPTGSATAGITPQDAVAIARLLRRAAAPI